MKIVIAIHHFPPQRTAGAELQAYRTARALQERGHEVFVVCVDAEAAVGPGERFTWRDELVDGIPVRRLRFSFDDAPEPLLWEYDNPWIGEQLRAYFEQVQPDLFHLYGGYLITARPLLIARELGIPTVVALTEFWFLCRRFTMLRSNNVLCVPPVDGATCARCISEEHRFYRMLGKLAPNVMQRSWSNRHELSKHYEARKVFLLDALQQATVIISQSVFVGEMFVTAGVPRERLQFIRQGQDADRIQKEARPKRTSAQLRVGYLGQIAWHKGVHVLVEAVRGLHRQDIALHVYGNLEQDKKYVAQLRRIMDDDGRIMLHGTVMREAIAGLFDELDVLVVPSLWYENSPNVIFEAFTHRTPVVASRLGGMAELVQHGENGLLFAAGDVKDLQQQLAHLLDEPGLVAQLQTGIHPVKRLDEETDELEQVYFAAVREMEQSSTRSDKDLVSLP